MPAADDPKLSRYQIFHFQPPSDVLYFQARPPSGKKGMRPMETTEEALLNDLFPDIDDLLKESWPVPDRDQIAKEFEDYLADIGVRA